MRVVGGAFGRDGLSGSSLRTTDGRDVVPLLVVLPSISVGSVAVRNVVSISMVAAGVAVRGFGAPNATKRSVRSAMSVALALSMSATGTRHWKASIWPVTGETGAHVSETMPSAVQAGSRGALTARASHSLTRPVSPCSPLSTRAIRVALRCVKWALSSSGASASRAVFQSRDSSAVVARAIDPSAALGSSLANWRTRSRRSEGLSPMRA